MAVRHQRLGAARPPREDSFCQSRHELRLRLESRRGEIEQAVLTRIHGIADPTEIADPAYVNGFRGATTAAVDFAFAALDSSEDRLAPIPPILLVQARLAARSGVGLDIVLRRYTGCHALLVDFLIEEVERDGSMRPENVRRLLAIGSFALDRLIAAVSEDFVRELALRTEFSQTRRRAETVARILSGEVVDTTDLSYEFAGWHIGVVAQGDRAEEQIRTVMATVDCRALVVPQDEGLVYAWGGSRNAIGSEEIASRFISTSGVSVAIGEPARGLAGWRLTHRQAAAALPISLHRTRPVTRYAAVALVAATLEHPVLFPTLRMRYLDPLRRERDGGAMLCETLKAYFESERNVSSAAALLRVSRRAVSKRLRRVEELTGCPYQKEEIYLALAVSEFLGRESGSKMALPVHPDSHTGTTSEV